MEDRTVEYYERFFEFSKEEIDTIIKYRNKNPDLCRNFSFGFMLKFTREWNKAVNALKKEIMP